MLSLILAATLHCERVDLPKLVVMDGCEKMERSASYQRCTLDDPAITKVVNATVERHVRERADYDVKAEEPPGTNCPSVHTNTTEVWCDEPYRSGDVLSYDCLASWTGGAHPDGTPWSIVLDTRGPVRELKLRDLFATPDAEKRFWELVRADVRHQVEGDDVSEDDIAGAERHVAAFGLTQDGLSITYPRWAFHGYVDSVEIPYASLRDLLLPRFLPSTSEH